MIAEDESSGDFIIRDAEPGDLSVLVGFMAGLALHVAGGVHRTLKKQERRKLRDLLASALEDDNKKIVVAEVPGAGLVGMGYIYIWRSHGIGELAKNR